MTERVKTWAALCQVQDVGMFFETWRGFCSSSYSMYSWITGLRLLAVEGLLNCGR